jgi:hypothetical protein
VLTYETQHAAGIDSPNLVCSDWSPDGRYVIGSVPQQTTGDDLWLTPLSRKLMAVSVGAGPTFDIPKLLFRLQPSRLEAQGRVLIRNRHRHRQ